MRLSSFVVAAVLAAIGTFETAAAQGTLPQSLKRSVARPMAASDQVVIMMRINVAKNAKPTPEGIAAAQRLAEFISKQPGFIDGQVLRNANAGQRPHFINVTRWKSFEDWERLFSTPAVIEAMNRESAVLSVTGSAFVPVGPK